MGMDDLQRQIGANARDKGFWEAHDNLDPFLAACYAKLALIGTEVAEAVEEVRDITDRSVTSVLYFGDDGKPEGLGSELADVVIRCLDMAEWLGIDLGSVIDTKAAYNATRPAMHGRGG